VSNVRRVYAHGKWIEVETLDTGSAVPKRARNPKRFAKFPWLWLEVLSKPRASSATFLVAAILLDEAWQLSNRSFKPIVKLTDVMLKRVGVEERGKRTALVTLEQRKLVSVARRANRNPLVTVHFFD
jgi:hypothetical protein